VLVYLFYINQAEVFHVLLLLTVRGIAQAFQMPAFSTLPAIMVQKERIPKVNALNSLLNSLIFIASPGIGAVLLGFFSIGDLLWIDVITYVPAFFVLLFVKIKDVRKIYSESNKRSSFVTDFREGISYIRTSGLFPLIASFSVISIFLNPLFSLIPLLITDVHFGNQNDLAFVEILAHVGMLIGSLFILLWKGFKPTFNKIIVGSLFLLFSMLAMALVPSKVMILLGITIFFAGLAISVVDVQFMSLLQLIVPPELQGRVFTSLFTMMKSFIPIALVGWGILAEFTGIHFVFVISPIIAIFLVFVMVLFTQIRFLDKKFAKTNLTELSTEEQAIA
jgi:DHA3 family macrolide efflux protein-like MFS transporter